MSPQYSLIYKINSRTLSKSTYLFNKIKFQIGYAFKVFTSFEHIHIFSTCVTSLTARVHEAVSEGSDVPLLLSLPLELLTLLTSLDKQPPPTKPQENASLNFTVNTHGGVEEMTHWGVCE